MPAPLLINTIQQLVAQADVFIDSYPSSSPNAVKLDYAALIDDNPGLIVTSLSPLGLTGPYRDYACHDINVSAAGGMSGMRYSTFFVSEAVNTAAITARAITRCRSSSGSFSRRTSLTITRPRPTRRRRPRAGVSVASASR